MDQDLYRNKYQIKSTRYEGFNYSDPGYYFVTICCENKIKHFSKVINEATVFTDIGRIVYGCWLDIPNHFPVIKLDLFVIMPNHIHGILIIEDTVELNYAVETRRGASLQTGYYKNKFGPLQKNSLSSVINHFKGSVKKLCNKNKYEFFRWQPLFYDRIIRNDIELNKIRQYIIDNPLKWSLDPLNK